MSTKALLAFAALAAAEAVVFLLIPLAYSRWLFLGFALACVAIPGYRYRHGLARDHFLYRIARTLLTVFACTLMLLAMFDFQDNASYPEFRDTFKTVIWGGLLLGVAVFLRGWGTILPRPASTTAANEKTRWIPLVLALLMLAALSEINHPDPFFDFLEGASIHVQMGLLAGAIGGLMVGLGGNLHIRFNRHEALPVLAVTLLALMLRFWRLDSLMHRLVDEIHFMYGVARLWQPEPVQILHPFGDVTAFTAVHNYMNQTGVALFGRNLFGLRFFSALCGTLTIPALYLLARTLFDRTTGLIAALILATMPVHIHFSRLALNNIVDPFWGTLALAFMTRAYFTRRRLDFTLAGVALGLTQYFYEGGRLLFPPLMLGWMLVGVIYWRVPLKGVLITLLTAAALAAPVYITLNSLETSYAARMEETSMSQREWVEGVEGLVRNNPPPYFKDNFVAPLMVYFQNPDGGWFYGRTLLVIYGVPALLLGIVHLVWRGWQPAVLLMAAWVAAATLGNTFLHESDWSPRFVVVFPALALLMAVGVRYTAPLLMFPPRLKAALLALTLTAITVSQMYYYFADYLPTANSDAYAGRTEPDDALFRATTLPDETIVFLIDDMVIWQFNINAFKLFYESDARIIAIFPESVPQYYQNAMVEDRPYAFFVDARDTTTLPYLSQYFELGEPEYSPYDVAREKQMVLYRGKKKQP